ncbi:MAG: beta strand repeat-containing protein, partial [Cyclobacteriaceae bacterium]
MGENFIAGGNKSVFISKRNFYFLKLSVLSLFLLAGLNTNVFGQTWIGTSGGDWQNGANWVGGLSPSAGGAVVISFDQSASITNIPTISLNSLTVSGDVIFESASNSESITITSSFSVVSGKTFRLGNAGNRFNQFLISSSATGTVAGTAFVDSNTINRLFQVDGDLTIPVGGLITGNGTASQFTVSSAGTLRIGSTSGITSSGATGSIQVTSTRTYSTGANYHYIGNANQAVGSGLPTTVASLTISNVGGGGNETVSLGSSITITNALTVNSGVFALGTNNITSVGSINMTGTLITGTGTISLNGNISTNISATTATIGAPMSLGAVNRTFTIPDGAAAPDLSISSVISGGGGIIKAGTGSYIPSGSNTYTGVTTISVGRIRLGANGGATNTPLGTTAGGTVVSSGAELDLNGFTLGTAEPLSLNGTGILSGGTLNNTSGLAATYSGLLTLAGPSTIVANAGAIALSGGVTGAFNLTLDGTTGGSVASIIGIGTGSVIKNGTGSWTLSGINTFSGGTTLNLGTLNINNSSALGSVASTFTINGGIFDNTSAGSITTLNYPQAWNSDLTFTGTRDLNLGTGTVTLSANRQVTTTSGILTIGGTISAASFNLTKAGAGSLIFGANAVTLNGLSINSGTFTAPSTTLNLSGNFVNGGTFNNNGGTVNFNGGSSQSVAGVNYNIVTASGAGTKNATGNINIGGTFTNASIFDMGTNTLTVVGVISNTGTIRFGGATNGFAISTGIVEYNGPSQTVGIGTYQNLTINQSSGDAVLTGATTVNGVLGLNGGNLNVGTSILTLGSSATTTGAPARFIIAAGGGEVRKIYSSLGAFIFPIGENTGVTEYSPITVNVTSGGGLPSYVGVSVVDAKHPNNASATNFLNRYWNVTTGITGCTANVSTTYPNASINGTEASISAGQLKGVFNQTTNPWIKFTALAGNILNANVSTINIGQTSVFTGIIGSNPTADAGVDKVICNLLSTSLGGAPTASGGAGGYIYSWSPSTGLSATNVSNPTFTSSGTGTTTYTVTITDANGIVATNPADVTVNPIPSPAISGTNSVCENQSGVVYTTAGSGNNYVWSISGGTITAGAGTNSVTVTWNGAGPGTLQLTETIPVTLCSVATPTFNVTINANPTPVIGGTSTVCANQPGFTYTTAPAAGRSYSWSVTGGTITAGAATNTITVSWGGSGAGSVQLTETISSTSCSTIATAFPVTINPLPTPTISGANSACENQSGVVYTTSGSGNNYVWSISGGTITAGAGTNSVTVTWNGAGPGTLQLMETIPVTLCSVTTPTFNVTINANPTPVIGGTSTVCANQPGFTYTTAPAAGRSYAWSVTGGTITAGAATNTITVSWGGSGAGSVQLTETISSTSCSTIATAFPVTINPLPTPTISGANSACENQSGVVYTTAGSGNNYVWSISGGMITAGAGTN